MGSVHNKSRPEIELEHYVCVYVCIKRLYRGPYTYLYEGAAIPHNES